MQRFYYLGSLITVFLIPALIIMPFVIGEIPLVNFVLFIIGIMLLGGIWDIWATRHGKRDRVWIWEFNHKDSMGITLFDLPIEEYLFYLMSSSYIIFMWEGINLAVADHNQFIFILIPILALWSLFAALLPYWIKPKGDRL